MSEKKSLGIAEPQEYYVSPSGKLVQVREIVAETQKEDEIRKLRNSQQQRFNAIVLRDMGKRGPMVISEFETIKEEVNRVILDSNTRRSKPFRLYIYYLLEHGYVKRVKPPHREYRYFVTEKGAEFTTTILSKKNEAHKAKVRKEIPEEDQPNYEYPLGKIEPGEISMGESEI